RLLVDSTPLELEGRSRYHQAVTLYATRPLDVMTLGMLPGVAGIEAGPEPFSVRVLARTGAVILPAINSLIVSGGWDVPRQEVERGSLNEVLRLLTREYCALRTLWSLFKLLLKTARLDRLEHPYEVTKDFKASGERYLIAVRLQGPARSAFSETPEANATSKHINVVVVTHTDALSANVLADVQGRGENTLTLPWAYGAQCARQPSGSDALISPHTRGRYSRIFTAISVVGGLLVLPANALAGCVVSGNKIVPSVSDVPNDSGGMISSVWHSATMSLICTNMSRGTYTNTMGATGLPAGASIEFDGASYNLYQTGESDVFYFGTSSVDGGTEHGLSSNVYQTTKVSFATDFTMRSTVKVRFYSPKKSMTSGLRTINTLDVITGKIAHENYSGAWTMRTDEFTFVAKGTSCTLTTPATIKLKQVSIVDMPSIGSSIAGGAFVLGLKCNMDVPTFQVSYGMADVYNPSNLSSYLSLADEPAKASGIALQVLNGTNAISFAPSATTVIGNLRSGTISHPMTVQYIRTGKNATPGKANAAVSVTFTYD
ncbi:fimbrial protein, partial [Pseudomonas sp. AU8050]